MVAESSRNCTQRDEALEHFLAGEVVCHAGGTRRYWLRRVHGFLANLRELRSVSKDRTLLAKLLLPGEEGSSAFARAAAAQD